jgi:hypothetical protein
MNNAIIATGIDNERPPFFAHEHRDSEAKRRSRTICRPRQPRRDAKQKKAASAQKIQKNLTTTERTRFTQRETTRRRNVCLTNYESKIPIVNHQQARARSPFLRILVTQIVRHNCRFSHSDIGHSLVIGSFGICHSASRGQFPQSLRQNRPALFSEEGIAWASEEFGDVFFVWGRGEA